MRLHTLFLSLSLTLPALGKLRCNFGIKGSIYLKYFAIDNLVDPQDIVIPSNESCAEVAGQAYCAKVFENPGQIWYGCVQSRLDPSIVEGVEPGTSGVVDGFCSDRSTNKFNFQFKDGEANSVWSWMCICFNDYCNDKQFGSGYNPHPSFVGTPAFLGGVVGAAALALIAVIGLTKAAKSRFCGENR